ncbi:primosomal replication protein [Shewanella psychrotolerans]|uniref:primosomal replication protein n=1 Tax=Shewanella psychrotolerans TaxID=2864206 RepID=UPI001C65E950|nr:primosomal replication protein [Shewanella psychrotolerans]QYK02641.1 primosomal replication protein [Shewanella psychrotolerans]
MKTAELIHRLRVQLKQLEQEVLQHDSQLAKGQRKLLSDTERFNQGLFDQTGAQLEPCILQLSKKIAQLEKLLKGNISTETIALSCEGIQDRFTAVRRALNTTTLDVKSAEQQRASRFANAKKRRQQSHAESGFGWIATGVMHNSHQLYEELNKHFNWVQMFEQKIEKLQSKLENCHSADKIALQNEILLVHRRLGKCRQAISYIEDRIQAFERPYKRQNR